MKDNDRENMFGELIGNLKDLPKEEQKKFVEKLREAVKIPQKKEDDVETELRKIDESIESIQKKVSSYYNLLVGLFYVTLE